jgi:hypothetical protein
MWQLSCIEETPDYSYRIVGRQNIDCLTKGHKYSNGNLDICVRPGCYYLDELGRRSRIRIEAISRSQPTEAP